MQVGPCEGGDYRACWLVGFEGAVRPKARESFVGCVARGSESECLVDLSVMSARTMGYLAL